MGSYPSLGSSLTTVYHQGKQSHRRLQCYMTVVKQLTFHTSISIICTWLHIWMIIHIWDVWLAWVACRSCYVARCTCVTWSKWFNTWLCDFTRSIRSLISKAFCTGSMVVPTESPRGHEASHGNVWETLVRYYVIVDVVIWAISFILAGSSVSFSLHWSQRGTGRLWEGYVHAWTINIPQLPEK